MSKRIFDLLTSEELIKYKNGELLKEFILTVLILVFVTIALNYINAVFDSLVELNGQKLMFSLNIKYNLKSTSISYELLSHPSTLEMRELAGKAINGSNFIDMVRSVKKIISNSIVLIGVIAIFARVNAWVLVIVIAVIVINTVANNIIKKVQYKHSVEVTPYMRKISYIQSVSSGFEYGKEIRLNSYRPLLLKKVDALNKSCFRFMNKIIKAQTRGIKISHITNGIQSIVVYIWLGYSVIKGILGIGDFSMYFNATNQFKDSFLAIISTLADIKIHGLYMGHFLKYMNLPDEDQEDQNAKSIIDQKTFHNISFENVSFIYPGQEKYVLKNVSFSICQGEKLSIVGLNGSGKTTIVKLLLRLYKPVEGRILIDGQDINEIDYDKYKAMFSVVFQDFKLFAFTIRENLCGDDIVCEDELNDIMNKVGLESKIKSLPNGYNTNYSRLFDESGVEFSGGESQKLAIARALYKNAPIVIMDEPTSALDPVAEYEIYKDFDKLTLKKTAIYISHRLSSCRFCDNILVLNHGEVVEYGSHDLLMSQNGMYSDMYSKQAQFYIDSDDGEKR